MALNHRLSVLGSDLYNNNLEIKVFLEGYPGAPVEREGTGAPFSVEWGADTKQLPIIYGSEAKIKFWVDVDYEFNDLFTETDRDVYIEALINDSLFWAGFIEAGKWNEPLISAKYEVNFSAFDGLGLLADEDFLNPDKTAITGEYTAREIAQMILAKTGLLLPLNTAVNVRPSTEAAGTDPLDQYKINVEVYEGLSCLEVLEQLFKNCRIQQRGGQWYIISNTLLKAASITAYQYSAAGDYTGTAIINPRVTGYTLEDVPEMETQGALKQLTVIQDYGYIQNLLNNADFAEFENGKFTFWTANNVTPEQRVLDTDGNKYMYIPGREKSDPWEQAARIKYVKSDSVPVTAASDTFNIKIKYALMGAKGEAADIFIGVLLTGTGGTTYTLEAYLNDDHEIAYRWVLANYPYPVPVKSYVNHKERWFLKDQYELRSESIEAHPHNEIVDNFREAVFNAETIPVTGTVSVYLFAANSSRAEVAGACFNVIDMFLTDASANEFATQKEITLVNDLKNNYTPDDIKIINGDTPDVNNRLTIYRGQFVLTDGTPTDFWTVDGTAAAYTYAELMGRLLASEFKNTKQTYKAILADLTPGPVIVFEDTDNNNNGRYMVEAGVTFDFRLNRVEGRYIELLDINLDSYTMVEKLTVEASNKSNSTTTGGTVLNTDEKVKLIAPDTFEILGQGAYLSAEYFDQEIDPTTGRAVIVPAKTKKQEIAAGVIDGQNKTFTLDKTPVGEVLLFLYPVTILLPGTFTIVDKTITLGPSIVPPVDEERIIAFYDYYIKEV